MVKESQIDLQILINECKTEFELQKIIENIFNEYEDKINARRFRIYDLSLAYFMALTLLDEDDCPTWKFDFCQKNYHFYRNETLAYLRGHIK